MARKKTDIEAPPIDSGLWMVTFSDLVMLLLTFFVLLLTMSALDTKKMKDMFSHFSGAAEAIVLSDLQDAELFSGVVEDFNTSDNRLVVDQRLLQQMFLPRSEENGELPERVAVKLDELVWMFDDYRGLVVSFQNEILFDSGSADLKPESFAVLDRIAAAIAACPNDIEVVGHTDSTPMRGSAFASNWELSMHRGLAVLDHFLHTNGLSPHRFSVGGCGASRPAFSNDTLRHRAQNRRVEIVFKHMPR
jgi:chemotaxis protein MotB